MACPLNPGKPLTKNNVIAYYLLILPAKRIASKNELAVDYYSAFNPKSTELFAPGTALGGGGVFHYKIRSRHSRGLKLSRMIACITFYKIC